ncbi:MAG: hypothetical protein ACM3PF_12005 [Bacteroidota bacterium]
MSHPIAVAFLHGIGRTEPGYSRPLADAIAARFVRTIRDECSVPATQVVFEEVNWSGALQPSEDRLWSRFEAAEVMSHRSGIFEGVARGPAPNGSPAAAGGNALRWEALRHFMLDFAADAIAYQPTESDRSAYDAIHAEVASTFARLAERAGARAPLCVIGHSLGTVIASNYLYDLLKPRKSYMAPEVRARIGSTPLERGETVSLVYTMGSPIALWSLRYPGFGVPVSLPARRLARHHPDLRARWVNLYDPDDVIGYPLKPVNARYAEAVAEDRAVDVGSWLTRWNPLSHTGYWGDAGVASLIATDLAEAWRRSSAVALVPVRSTTRSRRAAASP